MALSLMFQSFGAVASLLCAAAGVMVTEFGKLSLEDKLFLVSKIAYPRQNGEVQNSLRWCLRRIADLSDRGVEYIEASNQSLCESKVVLGFGPGIVDIPTPRIVEDATIHSSAAPRVLHQYGDAWQNHSTKVFRPSSKYLSRRT
jgi:hypothetical protein